MWLPHQYSPHQVDHSTQEDTVIIWMVFVVRYPDQESENLKLCWVFLQHLVNQRLLVLIMDDLEWNIFYVVEIEYVILKSDHFTTSIYCHVCVYIHKYTHAYIHYTYIYIRIYIHTYIHINIYIHTYTHTYIHTYIHSYIYT